MDGRRAFPAEGEAGEKKGPVASAYQYVFGGPYDVREELWGKFPVASKDDVDTAVQIVDQRSGGLQEWVRKGDY